ncbi:MAG: hypothetical protein KAR39_12505 [Thermoplasmata archaeon]|nr:hypothetical protein [Thermoplasmata archaeon]
MKRALQAMLIAGEEQKESVLLDNKTITIREGHRLYTPGPVMIGCHILDWATLREIVSVRHTYVSSVTVQEFTGDGFKSYNDMLESLRKFYPDLQFDSPVTVIRWT